MDQINLNNMNKYDGFNGRPLCVDLDGTLIKTDSIIETLLIAIKKSPVLILLFPFWLLMGKNYFKNRIVKYGIPDVSIFPYNEEVIELIKNAKSQGRTTVLSTATREEIATAVGEHTQLFDEVICSTDTFNNRSSNKANVLINKFGDKGFDYIGNGYSDIAVFERADKSILISDNKHLIRKVSAVNSNLEIIKTNKNNFKYLLKGMRIYQWTKNVLIFLPLVLAHEFTDYKIVFDTLVGFLCFSFTASFIYLVNDLMDLESDRRHTAKYRRPFASGDLSPVLSLTVSFVFLLISFVVSFTYLPSDFGFVLTAYLILTISYSIYLKKITILDIITLSVLYSIRIIAGSEITNIALSKWFLAFSLFLFFSLAIIKRYTELSNLLKQNQTKTIGRGYQTDDMTILLSMGTSSGYLSVLIFLFYIFSPDVIKLYKEPILLMPVSIILLFWITRMWFLARRGEMNEDPLVFTSKDKYSYLMLLIAIVFIIIAI